MRVLAVDPGLTRCGVGVIDGEGAGLQVVTVGVIRTSAELPLHERLHELHTELEAVFERTRPDAVAIERMFARHDVSTIMGTAQASTVPMLAAASRGLPVGMHTPSEVKAAVTGNGRADKAQVTAMVMRILKLENAPKPADAADALALAICHVWRGGAAARRATSDPLGHALAPAARQYQEAAQAASRRSRSAAHQYREALSASLPSAAALTRDSTVRGNRP